LSSREVITFGKEFGSAYALRPRPQQEIPAATQVFECENDIRRRIVQLPRGKREWRFQMLQLKPLDPNVPIFQQIGIDVSPVLPGDIGKRLPGG
jgi:hypothetical protein